MIDEDRTMQLYGYYSTDLKPKSHKPIVKVCDDCGTYSITTKHDYRDLCLSCAKSGKPSSFKNKHHSEESKIKNRNAHLGKHSGKNNPMFGIESPMKGKHHSEEIKDKMRGNKNGNWNPNLTNKERIINRNYPEYREWRNEVFKRDNYTCQCCWDEASGHLNAHHIESYDNNSDLRIELSNGITLCEDCHKDFHHIYGKGNNTQNQYDEFFKYKLK